MNSRKELIEYCRSFPGVYEDYPFHDDNWTLMRCQNKKTFALIYEHHGQLCLNVKCDPAQADFWRNVYDAVIPGYHMNKTHWNTVLLNGTVSEGDLEEMIRHSYELVRPAFRKPKKTVDK
jgi:predicted DNA-binding protein (MmcQ/YjbR family)